MRPFAKTGMARAAAVAAVVAVAAAAATNSATNSTAPSVHIPNGTVLGGQCAARTDAVFYKGIPFAQPPIGDLRFAPPVRYNQSFPGGVLNATAPAPACIQFGSGAFAERDNDSEDCLYLDVWAPANATNTSALPVRVWVFGGSNSEGGISKGTYDGCDVAAHGAVMVALNYRLGPLGFMALSDAGIAGNQAVRDLVMGLEWVQANIAAFGGDPRHVLLHGQSAGAVDTFTVATLPAAPQLMAAYASQSGGGRPAPDSGSAQIVGRSLAAALHCAPSNATCLRSASIAALQQAARNDSALHSGKQLSAAALDPTNAPRFTPFIDGTLVAVDPAAQGVRVPSIFGFNADDGSFFARDAFAKRPGGPRGATAHDFDIFLQQNFAPADIPAVKQQYPLANFQNTPDAAPAFGAIAAILTDVKFRCPAFAALNTAVANRLPAWAYDFAVAPHCRWLPSQSEADLAVLGATHSAEIPFVLGTTDDLPRRRGDCDMTHNERAVSDFMVAAWTGMAAQQRPMSLDPKAWPAYGGPNAKNGVTLGARVEADAPLDFGACALWARVNPIGAGANGTTSANGTAPAAAPTATGNGSNAGTAGTAAASTTGSVTSTTVAASASGSASPADKKANEGRAEQPRSLAALAMAVGVAACLV